MQCRENKITAGVHTKKEAGGHKECMAYMYCVYFVTYERYSCLF